MSARKYILTLVQRRSLRRELMELAQMPSGIDAPRLAGGVLQDLFARTVVAAWLQKPEQISDSYNLQCVHS